MKKYHIPLGLLICACAIASVASAHVVVAPASVPGGSYQTFSMGVPTEKEGVSTVSIKLMLPEGLSDVMPTLKPGWKINVSTSSILWSGGSIPSGFRDDFTFSAKTPVSGSLDWKAYQTYSNGVIVSWDAAPSQGSMAMSDDTIQGPYSITTLTPGKGGNMSGNMGMAMSESQMFGMNLLIPLLALGTALLAVWEINKMQQKK